MQGIVSWKLAVSMQPRMQDFKQAIQFWKHLPKSWKCLRWFPDYVAAAANRLHSSRSEKVLFCVWVNGCLFWSILFIFTNFHSGSIVFRNGLAHTQNAIALSTIEKSFYINVLVVYSLSEVRCVLEAQNIPALNWYVTVVSRLSHISLRRLQTADGLDRKSVV